MKNASADRHGFSAIELFVCVFASAILGVIVLVAIDHAQSNARKSQAKNNLRQVGLGMSVYHQTFQSFPHGSKR